MSAVNGQEDPWSNFENVRHSVKSHTVDRLKQIIAGLNEECRTNVSRQGKKQELIAKVAGELDKIRYTNQVEQWTRACSVINQVRTTGSYVSTGISSNYAANHAFNNSNGSGSAFVPKGGSNGHYNTGVASTSSIGRYDPYAPPRRAPTQSSSSPSRAGISVPIRFKASPFFKIDQAVSNVVDCPESNSSMDRRSQHFSFSLSQEHINKLTQTSPKYQVRLYCTTNAFYNNLPSTFRTQTQPCLIEFPATCEVRVNTTLLQANLKGIKKKPGTAPPADITKLIKMSSGAPNRVEMVYVNSQANSGPKKFYLVVFLVEVSSVDELVERLRKGKYRTFEEIRSQMNASKIDDDDIIAGKQKMTLKCPLSYTRIKIPCRSDKCVHPQCFDAFSWYSVMEQTTTWLCPVCEKSLEPNDLIVDGYFDLILESTPGSVEEVEVEPDGEWHTADDKYGSSTWLEARRHELSVKGKSISVKSVSSPPKAAQAQSASAVRPSGSVVILDSDSENEDENRVKKELSPSNTYLPKPSNDTVSVSSRNRAPAVIDLTLDSDPEDGPLLPTREPSLLKRKIVALPDSRGDDAYKRPRTDTTQKTMTPHLPRRESGTYTNGSSGSLPTNLLSRTLPPPTPTPLPPRSADVISRPLPPLSPVSPLTPAYDVQLPPYAPPGQRTYASGPHPPYLPRPPQPPYNSSPDSRRLPPPQPYGGYLAHPNGTSGGSWS